MQLSLSSSGMAVNYRCHIGGKTLKKLYIVFNANLDVDVCYPRFCSFYFTVTFEVGIKFIIKKNMPDCSERAPLQMLNFLMYERMTVFSFLCALS